MSEFRLGLPVTGFVSFLRAPVCGDLAGLAGVDADIGFLGIPYDEGSGWMTGQRFAPRKIREMTVRFAGHSLQSPGGFYDLEDGKTYLAYERGAGRFVDCGDSDIVITNVRKTFDNITRDVVELAKLCKEANLDLVVGGGVSRDSIEVLRTIREAHRHARVALEGTPELGRGLSVPIRAQPAEIVLQLCPTSVSTRCFAS